MKKLLLALIVLGTLLVAGVASYEWLLAGPALPRRDEFRPMPVKRGPVVEAVSATGLVQPLNPAVVSSEVPGRVVEVMPGADFNCPVKKDAPLVQLDDRVARQKLKQAELAVSLAEADVTRSTALTAAALAGHQKQLDLQERKVGLQRDLERAAAELKAARAVEEAARIRKQEAEAARTLAQLNLDLTTIRSPIDGTIIDKRVVVGQSLSPLTPSPLFTIVPDLKRMEVHAQLAEADIGKIKPGLPVAFSVQDFGSGGQRHESKLLRFEGKIAQVRPVPSAVQGAVFYTAVVEVDNQWDSDTQQWRLRPGMSLTVDIVRRQHPDVWLVPSDAVDFVLDEAYQSLEARKKIDEWRRKLTDGRDDWKLIWILDEEDKPWPIYARIGVKGPGDGGGSIEYQEVLEWDPDPKAQTMLKPEQPGLFPHVITDAPPVQKRGWFQPPRMPRFT